MGMRKTATIRAQDQTAKAMTTKRKERDQGQMAKAMTKKRKESQKAKAKAKERAQLMVLTKKPAPRRSKQPREVARREAKVAPMTKRRMATESQRATRRSESIFPRTTL